MKIRFFPILVFVICACRENRLYKDESFCIKKKELFLNYYKTSPDLFIKTKEGEIKIDLNIYGKNRIAQDKITSAVIEIISKDSILILFSTNDTTEHLRNQFIGINIKKVINNKN